MRIPIFTERSIIAAISLTSSHFLHQIWLLSLHLHLYPLAFPSATLLLPFPISNPHVPDSSPPWHCCCLSCPVLFPDFEFFPFLRLLLFSSHQEEMALQLPGSFFPISPDLEAFFSSKFSLHPCLSPQYPHFTFFCSSSQTYPLFYH